MTRSIRPARPPRLRDHGLVGTIGEAEFQRWVVATARWYGWHGVHVLDSEGNLQGIHQWDVIVPDWYFWLEDPAGGTAGRSFWRELKIDTANPRPKQRVIIASMRAAGIDVDVWRPRDELAIIETFRAAVAA